jgi:membrane carboxypeptidase/penicillin-binding protein PbpC
MICGSVMEMVLIYEDAKFWDYFGVCFVFLCVWMWLVPVMEQRLWMTGIRSDK